MIEDFLSFKSSVPFVIVSHCLASSIFTLIFHLVSQKPIRLWLFFSSLSANLIWCPKRYEEDVWTGIAKFLDGRSLVMLGATSRWFHHLIMEDSVWKYVCLRDLQVPAPRHANFKWINLYASAFGREQSTWYLDLQERFVDLLCIVTIWLSLVHEWSIFRWESLLHVPSEGEAYWWVPLNIYKIILCMVDNLIQVSSVLRGVGKSVCFGLSGYDIFSSTFYQKLSF